MQYDVLIVGGGPGGIYSAYELLEKRPDLKIALFEAGHALARRHCPIDGVKVKSCVKCPTCAIMNGFGGAGAFSDGKYNITNQFGGTLHEYIGKKQALELMEYVDEINVANGGEGTHLYSTGATPIKKLCLENDLHLLDASVRHLGTDKNLVVLEHLYNRLKDRMDIYFDTPVQSVERTDGGYRVVTDKGSYDGRYCVISVGRSGSKWMEQVCRELDIATRSNRVDIGVRVELPYEVFAHLTDELYESKIVYRTEKFQDRVRTFCMNPKGAVVNENTNGISQPFIRASDPAAAQARASVSTSPPDSSSVEPILAPQSPRRPSRAMAVLQSIWRPTESSMRETSTVSAKVRISRTFSTLLSCKLSSAESEWGFSSRTSLSRST